MVTVAAEAEATEAGSAGDVVRQEGDEEEEVRSARTSKLKTAY